MIIAKYIGIPQGYSTGPEMLMVNQKDEIQDKLVVTWVCTGGRCKAISSVILRRLHIPEIILNIFVLSYHRI